MPVTKLSANTDRSAKLATIRKTKNVTTIASPPRNGGSSEATSERKNSKDSRKMNGNASSSACAIRAHVLSDARAEDARDGRDDHRREQDPACVCVQEVGESAQHVLLLFRFGGEATLGRRAPFDEPLGGADS